MSETNKSLWQLDIEEKCSSLGNEIGSLCRNVKDIYKWMDLFKKIFEKVEESRSDSRLALKLNESTARHCHAINDEMARVVHNINEIEKHIYAERVFTLPTEPHNAQFWFNTSDELKKQNESLRKEVADLQQQIKLQSDRYELMINNLSTQLKHYQNYVPGVCL